MPVLEKRRKGARNAAATRAALLGAAAEAFTARGYDGASVDAIARAAGVNKAMVSYHFGGKAGLHAAILDADFATIGEGLAQIRASERGAAERLVEFIEIFGALHERSPNLSVLLIREMLAGGRHLDPVVLPRFLAVFQTISEILAQGVREGVFRPVEPFLLHQSLVGSLVFFFAIRPFRERLIAEGKLPVARAPGTDAYVRHVATLVIRGLAPSPTVAASEES